MNINLKEKLYLYILILSLLFISPLYGDSGFNFRELKVGDLIFQHISNSKLAAAIEKIAPGFMNFPISHVAMVYSIKSNKISIIEAYNRVRIIDLKTFLNRSLDENGNPKIIVGRLKKIYLDSISNIIKNCQKYMGKPYDPEFSINNDKYYCSELIYNIFKIKNNHLFELKPMNYICESDPSITKFWKYYFNVLLKKDVPQGELGITPGDISLSHKLNIIYFK